MVTHDYPVWLLSLSRQLETTIAAHIKKIDDLSADLAALDGRTCTGVEFWPADKPGCLYINHGMGQPCPIHGQPKKNSRLRCYVGRDLQAQAEATDAIRLE